MHCPDLNSLGGLELLMAFYVPCFVSAGPGVGGTHAFVHGIFSRFSTSARFYRCGVFGEQSSGQMEDGSDGTVVFQLLF